MNIACINNVYAHFFFIFQWESIWCITLVYVSDTDTGLMDYWIKWSKKKLLLFFSSLFCRIFLGWWLLLKVYPVDTKHIFLLCLFHLTFEIYIYLHKNICDEWVEHTIQKLHFYSDEWVNIAVGVIKIDFQRIYSRFQLNYIE